MTKAIPAKAPDDPRLRRWRGAAAPARDWPADVATDVLVLAHAPGLDTDAVDSAVRPLAAALRGLAGAEVVVSRARPGEARLVVRFAANAAKGAAAIDAVLAAWLVAPPPGFTPPLAEAIGRGARAIAALETIAIGGRPEATRYADAHPDALRQASHFALRTHLAGAVRPLIALRLAPGALASYGVGMKDVLEALQAWLAKTAAMEPPPVEAVRNAVQTIKLKRHWTADGQTLPPAPLDRLVDVSVEQGEPIREARNGQLPTTFWLIDGPAATAASDLEAGLRKVAAESKDVFRPTVQTLGTSFRLILAAPDGKEPESTDDLGKRLLALRQTRPSIVAINAIGGHDGVPEALDVDASGNRCWTVWLSIAPADVEREVTAAREALKAGGWDVHILVDGTDTALSWALDAWGTGGALISADDAAVLGPALGRLAQRALVGGEKAGMRQGPPLTMAPLAYRRVDAKSLLASKLTPFASHLFAEVVADLQPLGWWYETPVWLGMPTGEAAATVGQTPLTWQVGGGSGPNHAWLASDVLRVADTTPALDRVRVNGRPALWAVAETFTDSPASVSSSFWKLVESTMEMPIGMRVEPLDVSQHPLVSEATAERATP